MPKVLHFADLHLGASFRRFMTRGKMLREGLKQTLVNIVKAAQEEGVDLVIAAGDLVDSNKVSPAAVDFIISQFEKIKVPIVVLPGTHDCYDKESIYRRKAWSRLANLHIFTGEQGQTFEFPHLSVAIHGRPNLSNRDTTSPLHNLTPSPGYRWNVAVVHGSLQIEGKSAEDDFPFTFDELAGCEMDYVCCGHWHSYFELRAGKTVACYAGAAGTLSFSEPDSGTICIVDLADGGPNIYRVPVSHHKWVAVELSYRDLGATLNKHKDPHCLLKVAVQDKPPAGEIEAIRSMIDQFESNYFYLDVAYSAEDSQDLRINPDDYPETTFAGQFIRLARRKIETAGPDEKPVLEEALREGSRILLTGEVD